MELDRSVVLMSTICDEPSCIGLIIGPHFAPLNYDSVLLKSFNKSVVGNCTEWIGHENLPVLTGP